MARKPGTCGDMSLLPWELGKPSSKLVWELGSLKSWNPRKSGHQRFHSHRERQRTQWPERGFAGNQLGGNKAKWLGRNSSCPNANPNTDLSHRFKWLLGVRHFESLMFLHVQREYCKFWRLAIFNPFAFWDFSLNSGHLPHFTYTNHTCKSNFVKKQVTRKIYTGYYINKIEMLFWAVSKTIKLK